MSDRGETAAQLRSSLHMKSGGFSLLELLAVIVIIAVLSGLIVPMLGSDAGRDAAASASRLVQLINQARGEAVMSARIWQLELDPVDHSYRFLQLAGDEFDAVAIPPFAGKHHQDAVTFNQIEINGQLLQEAGPVYLFPTGEQDAFRMVVSGGQDDFAVAMGPVGEARLEEL